uniref:Uncharacterized protein n=1 Tax=Oryza meridionalis TaxID=40149 RepID=A0A0E0CUM1_9ORYZ
MSTWMADEDAALLLSGSIRLNPCGRTTGATGTGYMSLASPANPGDAGALGGSSDLTLCLCSRCTGDEPRLGVGDAPLLGVVSPLICARNSSASRSFFFSLACMKNKTQSGRLNQKYLLLGSTTGAPLITVALSCISCAISMITISSFVPTNMRI